MSCNTSLTSICNICIDQVRFMRERILAAFIFEETQKTGVRKEAALAPHYLSSTNSELERAAFKQLTGRGSTWQPT